MAADYHFKTILVGDSGVGKSSLLLRYVDDFFPTKHRTTIGVDFKLKTLDLGRNRLVKLQIWDTSGEERFRSLTSSFYRGSDGVIVVYDVTNRESLRHAARWFQDAVYYCNSVEPTAYSRLLVGNKTDLTSKRVVTYEEGQAVANELGMPYIETSAKTTVNVEEAFLTMVRAMMDARRGNLASLLFGDDPSSFHLPIGGAKDVEQESWYSYYSCC